MIPAPTDPLSASWPRHTARTILRPLTLSDAESMHAYRSLPEVCRFLSHDPLTLDEVVRRLEGRLSGLDPTPGRLVRGVAIETGGRMVGDAMLRTQRGQGEELWIGYALHPRVWGQGLATEVARELCTVGAELGLPVMADAYRTNSASQRVLLKAGFALMGESNDDGQPAFLYRNAN